jgi:hypothetical protein
MNRDAQFYRIAPIEIRYLSDMIAYLSSKEVEISKEGAEQVAEVFNRIESRKHFDTIIDESVFDETNPEVGLITEETYNNG